MTVPVNDGCLWPLDPGCLTEEWESGFDEPAKERAVALASATMRRLTAYRVGGCPVTVRPCQASCIPASLYGYAGSYGDNAFVPMNWAGTWSNCGCGGPCRHNPRTSVKLPPPVYDVTEVRVGSTTVDPSSYWVTDGYLIRHDGIEWPQRQNLDLPLGAADTFGVTYYNSAPVDGMGAVAAAKLAIEYARACTGGECRLPETVVSVVRQGVTYELPSGAFPNGETGIREVDAYIALWNPQHRPMRPRVWVP